MKKALIILSSPFLAMIFMRVALEFLFLLLGIDRASGDIITKNALSTFILFSIFAFICTFVFFCIIDTHTYEDFESLERNYNDK